MRLPNLAGLSRARRQPKLTRAEAMAARPVRNPVVQWEWQDSGRVVLTVPLELTRWMKLAKLLVQVPDQRQIELDELGSDVWSWCDGEQDVQALCRKLAEAHKLNQREAETSLTTYLQTLARRRLIGFALPLEPARAEALGMTAGERS